MKKLIIYTLVSLSVVGFTSQPCMAGLFHWLKNKCCWGGCGKFSTTICMRQYNAFTPVCWGTIMCDGCCPIAFGGGGFMAGSPWMGAQCGGFPYCPPTYCPPACCTTGCCDTGCLPAPEHPHAGSPPPQPQPSSNANVPGYTPPPPTPLPAMSYQQMNQAMWLAMMQNYYRQAPVQTAAYTNGYYPSYNYAAYGYPANYGHYNYAAYGYPTYNPWMMGGYNYPMNYGGYYMPQGR